MMIEQVEQVEQTQQVAAPSEMDVVMAHVKSLSSKELVKLQKSIAEELGRRAEHAAKVPKASKASKAKSLKAEAAEPASPKEKGVVPVHLRQNHEWTAYVRDQSRANGWPAFTWNKDAKVKVAMPASESVDGQYVYPGLPAAHNTFTDAHAMSLAAELRSANDVLWTTWETTIYQASEEEIAKRASAAPKAPKAAKANLREEMSFEAYVASVEKKASDEAAKQQRMTDREAKKEAKAKEAVDPKAAAKAPKKAAAKKAKAEEESKETSSVAAATPAESSEVITLTRKKKVVKAVVVEETEGQRTRREWTAPAEGGAKPYYYINADGADVKCFRDDTDGIMSMEHAWIGTLNADFTVDTSASNPYEADDDSEDDKDDKDNKDDDSEDDE